MDSLANWQKTIPLLGSNGIAIISISVLLQIPAISENLRALQLVVISNSEMNCKAAYRRANNPSNQV